MKKTVILITGTPSVGKTTIAQKLKEKLNAVYINLSSFANYYNLLSGFDKERKTAIIDEEKMFKKIKEIIGSTTKSNIIIDGHYASSVVPKDEITKVFVLRRNPIELKKFMEKRKFRGNKLWENLESEILDVCLIETLSKIEETKVCELDITGMPVQEVVNRIISILHNNNKCEIGKIDWLTMLETKGLIDDYLKR
jgi:adenylate kinase